MKKFLLILALLFGSVAATFAVNYNSSFFTIASTIDDDQKLPLKAKGFSIKGNVAQLNNPVYVVADPSLGSFVTKDPSDPGNMDGYFVPSGPVGTTVVTVTGTNKNGVSVSGTLEVQVVAGPAVNIVIEALAPVPQ